MSNIKKIIGVLLALVMTLSMAAVAFAADGDKYSITITSDKTTLEAGQSATVTVKLTANYNVSAISIPVFFDKSKVTVSEGETSVSGATVVTEDSESVDSQIYNGSGLSKDQYGVRALVMVPDWGQSIKKYTDETVMTFTVTPVDGASGAVVFECVDASVKTTAKPGGSLYVGKNSSGKDTVDSNGEVIDDYDISGAKKQISLSASADKNTLVIEGSAPVTPYIDTTNAESTEYTGFIYGVDTLGFNDDYTPDGTLDDCLTTTLGDDYLQIETPESGAETTGTIIKVLDSDGESVLETYVFIYFGDVDMDGTVGAFDAYICEYYEMNYEGIDNLYQYIAGDVDTDGSVGAFDAYICEYYEMNYTDLSAQADIGEFASTNQYELY